jgi:hypothetical protein
MKKAIRGAMILVLLCAVLPQKAAAQKYKRQVNVTAGASFALAGLIVNTVLLHVDDAAGVSPHSQIGLNGIVDIGVTDRLSVGAAYSYQNIYADFTSFKNTAGDSLAGNYYISITRQNYSMRALLHFGDHDELDFYAGLRLGYTFWTSTTNAVGTKMDEGRYDDRFWPQVPLGVRYYIIPNLGLGAELGIGPPYYVMFGLHVRFGGDM